MSQRVAFSDVADPAAGRERARQLRQLTLKNFLSYGPEGTEFTFGSLNVLVGPNGSGKTNLIEALRVLRSSITGFGTPMLSGGGVEAYLFRGENLQGLAWFDLVLSNGLDSSDLHHYIAVEDRVGKPHIQSELVGERPTDTDRFGVVPYSRSGDSLVEVASKSLYGPGMNGDYNARILPYGRVRGDESGLEKHRDPDTLPLMAELAEFYESVAIYGEWTIGQGSAPRKSVLAGTRSDVLLEDASNLAFVLAELRSTKALPKLRAALRRLKATYEDFNIRPVGGQLQLFIEEEGVVGGINAMRLSDGTLRFLALAAVLFHPKPPALVVIDEPELGMHPDLIEAIAEMIADAATRTQLIVATHSPDLLTSLRGSVDRLYAFQAGPEGTSVRGFSREQLDAYLVDQPLGDLWRQGDFGGNRF